MTHDTQHTTQNTLPIIHYTLHITEVAKLVHIQETPCWCMPPLLNTFTTANPKDAKVKRWQIQWKERLKIAYMVSIYQDIYHYIILNNGILNSNSSISPRSEEYITQYTP